MQNALRLHDEIRRLPSELVMNGRTGKRIPYDLLPASGSISSRLSRSAVAVDAARRLDCTGKRLMRRVCRIAICMVMRW